MGRHPVHVTLRARPDLPSLRAVRFLDAITRAIRATQRPDFRIVHFSVQGDHVHLIVEAHDARALSSGVRGLSIRTARALNRILVRHGPVWGDRYHCRDLKTPQEVRNALVYVLCNARKHGRRVPGVDPCSSALWFPGWARVSSGTGLCAAPASARSTPAPAPTGSGAAPTSALQRPPVAAARTWLLLEGWRRRGLLHLDEAPRGAP